MKNHVSAVNSCALCSKKGFDWYGLGRKYRPPCSSQLHARVVDSDEGLAEGSSSRAQQRMEQRQREQSSAEQGSCQRALVCGWEQSSDATEGLSRLEQKRQSEQQDVSDSDSERINRGPLRKKRTQPRDELPPRKIPKAVIV